MSNDLQVRPSPAEFIAQQPDPHTSPSLVFCLDGGRGGGKTSTMTEWGVENMAKGRPCKSVYPIQGYGVHHGQPVWIDSGPPINYVDLVAFPQFERGTIILIDEANTFFDAYDTQRTGSRDFANYIQQIRKDQCSMFYCAQDYFWVDKRLRFQTDVRVHCYDRYYLPGAKEAGLNMGEEIQLTCYDLSGKITGKAYDAEHHPEGRWSMLFHCKPVWKYYPTDWKLSRLETDVKVVHDKSTVHIGIQQEAPPEPDIPTAEQLDIETEFNNIFKRGKN